MKPLSLSETHARAHTHTQTKIESYTDHYFPNTLFSALLGPLLSKRRQADGRTDRTARFEFLTMALMNIQVFRDVTLRRWVYIDVVDRFHNIQGVVVVVFLGCLVFKTEVLRSFETSVPTYPTHTMRFICSANNVLFSFFSRSAACSLYSQVFLLKEASKSAIEFPNWR